MNGTPERIPRETCRRAVDGLRQQQDNRFQGTMDKRKACPECDAIATETRSVFIRILSNRILDEELARFLACLFASEENLARLTELWERSEFADVRQRWLQHKRTSGHSGVFQYHEHGSMLLRRRG